jgi:hypothetical protein
LLDEKKDSCLLFEHFGIFKMILPNASLLLATLHMYVAVDGH